jgi:hypothetical protein
MHRVVAVLVLGFLTVGCAHAALLQASPAAPASPPAVQQASDATASARAITLTPDDMEQFLKTARIVSRRDAGNGVTNSRRATLSDGTTTHDAHIQVIDEARPVFQAGKVTELNFRDTYRYNIAAYRVARLLQLANVPMSVERRVDSKMAAVTWWVDDVQMDEKERIKRQTSGSDPERVSKQVHVMRVFDELIANRDRNQGNILWTSDFSMWMIDHTRAFRLARELAKPQQLTRIERSLFGSLRGLTRPELRQATAGVLTDSEVEAVLARRDALVKYFTERMAAMGEAAVLFTM